MPREIPRPEDDITSEEEVQDRIKSIQPDNQARSPNTPKKMNLFKKLTGSALLGAPAVFGTGGEVKAGRPMDNKPLEVVVNPRTVENLNLALGEAWLKFKANEQMWEIKENQYKDTIRKLREGLEKLKTSAKKAKTEDERLGLHLAYLETLNNIGKEEKNRYFLLRKHARLSGELIAPFMSLRNQIEEIHKKQKNKK
ncbi:MAG: hypothetical protein UR46_C0029G0002 [Parcubacteria group bacterium GW2011_GWA1_33_6]|uniref:Uncharacterized protein n=1 Tax=Candidatus Staskawiczbacteria bacterium RIFCSPHIGHO2_02_FULL_33_16 TaxID=1802204 RepID=A0A1G2HXX3_9BACT|nr:MAG: hypothetical protein UR31_C0006G0015 [Parcubacteria group bacterium GW2011_GWA2_33_14]KKP54193.1 MAG: hypothetical protein UR46_C0029G0002 [Parcubacteria group bacterium GW2011_GWA1_33_6]OGZ67041.1 MAG: hypothetical protein A3D34_02385 [Candidatus Staskawiczbacteria bacterium RIFCSPHIGHO2_02_FULL_33_16]OGZ70117.1 MAG: hypothetical protein A2980_03560 [Candidatus Staskawiczbacteria bacterium RIFCSPLOWO2_01_FULL_33_13]